MNAPHSPSLDSPVKGVNLKRVDVGSGVTLRVAEAGPRSGSLVLLLHGFPECWFSWRHQLVALAGSGYFAVAPDLRGFGGSDAPPDVADYDVHCIAADVLGLLSHYGRQQAYLVSHDFGATLTWSLARMFPERFPAICAMSVADMYDPHRPPAQRRRPPLVGFESHFGGSSQPSQGFMYIMYHCEHDGHGGPAEAEYDANPRLALYQFLSDASVPQYPPSIVDQRRSAGGMLGRMGVPKHLPSWLSQADLDYFVAQFSRPGGQGFRGGVNFYRNLNRNYYTTRHLHDVFLRQPLLFIAGASDPTLYLSGGPENVKAHLVQSAPGLRQVLYVPDCGHWVQQERPKETNEALLAFLKSVPLLATTSKL